MRAKRLRFVIGALVLLGGTGAPWAASPPSLLNYQGVLRSASGAPEEGVFDMVFAFYNSDGATFLPCPATGGTLLFTDSQMDVPVSGGLFSVQLGGGVLTPGSEGSLAEVFRDNATVYVEVTVAGEVLCPRVHVISAAYSLNADHLDGKDATEFLDTSVVAQAKGGDLAVLGSVGIGTASPSGSLHMFYGNGILMQGDGSSQLTLRFQDDDTGQNYELQGDTGFEGISFRMNGTHTAIFKADGNVGIGTTLPTEKLEVIGNGKFTGTLEATGNLQIGGDLLFADGTVQMTGYVPADPPCFDNFNRFVDCFNGTVTDTVTGLIWLKDANCSAIGPDTYAGANAAAASLDHGQCGLTDNSSPGDWRLPTDVEWQVILDRANLNGCSSPFFPDTLGTGCCGVDPCAFGGLAGFAYWSSSTFTPNTAVSVSLNSGDPAVNFKTVSTFVWPVRAGP